MALFFNKKKPQTEAPHTVIQELPLTAIVPNRFQPRKVFTPEAITELAETIQAHGLLQPMVVREYAPGQYEIIAGERRFRAMQSLHMEKAPAIVQTMTDEESAAMALIENLQREGLSAIEEAQAYVELMKLNQLTQADLAKQLGKSQSFVANKLRLLKLSQPVQEAIMAGELTERHGRELLKADDYQQQILLHEILTENLTVKETHAAVAAMVDPAPDEPEADQPAAPEAAGDASDADAADTDASDRPTKPKRQRKMIQTHDTRMALNTLRQSVQLIQKSGMQAVVQEDETEAAYRFIVELPKEKR